MNNNYYNPYAYGNGYFPQPNVTHTPTNTSTPNNIPFMLTNGLDGVKNYIMQPSRTVYFKDAYKDIIYKKTSDEMCNCTLKAYKLVEVAVDNVSTDIKEEYVLKSDFKLLEDNINKKLSELETKLGGTNNE